MTGKEQVGKAEKFRSLHQAGRILVLPNIWDPIGALLVRQAGFPAVATASAAYAWSNGLDDGERVAFDRCVGLVQDITAAVTLPVSVDMESGYADTPEGVAVNVTRILRAGAVGCNLEDSHPTDGSMRSTETQCERIRAAREAARRAGVPLFINARIDVCAHDSAHQKDRQAEMIDRGLAYREAGADGLYPIMVDDLEVLGAIATTTGLPVNVYAQASLPPIASIEAAGIARLSLGPGLLRAALTAMRDAVREIREEGSLRAVTAGAMSSDEVRRLIASRAPGGKS